MSPSGVVQVTDSAAKQAAALLSRAFQDDPVMAYFLPNRKARSEKLHRLFEVLVRYAAVHGEVYATSDRFEGIAVWLPADKVEIDTWAGVRYGGLSVLSSFGLPSVRRQVRANDHIRAVHKRLGGFPHLYLYLLGVDPQHRGQGHAARLLDSMFARLDAEGLACYLDNTNEANLRLYEHYGFRVLEEYSLPGTRVRLWAMLRPGIALAPASGSV